MALSEHQEDVKGQALEILETSKRLLIKGSAGVGKTYMVDDLLKTLAKAIPRYKGIYCAAPTNKAVAVLAEKITVSYPNVSLLTIHSAMKIGAVTNKQTGIKTFEPILSNNPKYHPLVGISLLIIDEASMIGEKMLEYIEDHATKNNTTVIFIGDDKQLNPVKEEDSPVFLGKPYHFSTSKEAAEFSTNLPDGQGYTLSKKNEDDYVCYVEYPEVELTEIVRQGKGNPIIQLSRNISALWELEPRVTDEGKGFVYTVDREKIISRLAEVNGSDELKYLAWTNSEVDLMNKEVRERIYNEPAKIEAGESLIFDEPYQDYFTNQEVKVETLNIVDIPFKLVVEDTPNLKVNDVTLKCYVINGRQVDEWGDGKLVWRGIFVIHEDAEQQLQNVIKLLKYSCLNKKLKWTSKNSFEDLFAKVTYNHAITIHKS